MNREFTVIAVFVSLIFLGSFGAWTFLSLPDPGTMEQMLATSMLLSALTGTVLSIGVVKRLLERLH